MVASLELMKRMHGFSLAEINSLYKSSGRIKGSGIVALIFGCLGTGLIFLAIAGAGFNRLAYQLEREMFPGALYLVIAAGMLQIVSGYFLLKRSAAAKVLGTIQGIVWLPGLPVGTILGILLLMGLSGEKGQLFGSDGIPHGALKEEHKHRQRNNGESLYTLALRETQAKAASHAEPAQPQAAQAQAEEPAAAVATSVEDEELLRKLKKKYLPSEA